MSGEDGSLDGQAVKDVLARLPDSSGAESVLGPAGAVHNKLDLFGNEIEDSSAPVGGPGEISPDAATLMPGSVFSEDQPRDATESLLGDGSVQTPGVDGQTGQTGELPIAGIDGGGDLTPLGEDISAASQTGDSTNNNEGDNQTGSSGGNDELRADGTVGSTMESLSDGGAGHEADNDLETGEPTPAGSVTGVVGEPKAENDLDNGMTGEISEINPEESSEADTNGISTAGEGDGVSEAGESLVNGEMTTNGSDTDQDENGNSSTNPNGGSNGESLITDPGESMADGGSTSESLGTNVNEEPNVDGSDTETNESDGGVPSNDGGDAGSDTQSSETGDTSLPGEVIGDPSLQDGMSDQPEGGESDSTVETEAPPAESVDTSADSGTEESFVEKMEKAASLEEVLGLFNENSSDKDSLALRIPDLQMTANRLRELGLLGDAMKFTVLCEEAKTARSLENELARLEATFKRNQ